MFSRADAVIDTVASARSWAPLAHADAVRATLPPSLAVMSGSLPADLLQRVSAEAARIGVPADVMLLNEGHVAAEVYYRALAASLDLPFAERPLRPSPQARLDQALATGVIELQANRHGWRYLVAPRGFALAAFLDVMRQRPADGRPAVALTSPDRLEALARRAQRRTVLRAASHGLPDWNHKLSARNGLSATQTGAGAILALLFCAAAWLAPAACLVAVHVTFFVAFLLVVTLRLATTAAGAKPSRAGQPRLPDDALPVYTIVVPLYRETRVIEDLVAALGALDYPRAKLDIILMVETDDPATLDALHALRLPACYRTIIAPRGRPQTKPRALNLALQFARGQFLVVYDAEDEPEPAQLRDALSQFAADPAVACLQARLAIDNTDDSWLTRLFTIEYAALFDILNPGLAALGLPVPLGGTSNHFRIDVLRHLNGWDAWNVTEDIDLGIRLARFGLSVQTLASSTYEEAPNTLKAWLTQRRRWLKGWIVTLGTHSRDPVRLYRDLGMRQGTAALALLFGTIASCLLGPFCAADLLLRLWSGALLSPQTPADTTWSVLSLALLSLGVVSAVWPALLGLDHRGAKHLWRWLPLMPVYLLLLSVAAWGAAFEVIGNPYVWAKTEHGRAKRRIRAATSG